MKSLLVSLLTILSIAIVGCTPQQTADEATMTHLASFSDELDAQDSSTFIQDTFATQQQIILEGNLSLGTTKEIVVIYYDHKTLLTEELLMMLEQENEVLTKKMNDFNDESFFERYIVSVDTSEENWELAPYLREMYQDEFVDTLDSELPGTVMATLRIGPELGIEAHNVQINPAEEEDIQNLIWGGYYEPYHIATTPREYQNIRQHRNLTH